MMPEDKRRIQSKIESAITQLHQDLPQLEAQARPVAPDEAIGRLTRMEAINSRSIAEANLRNARQKLARLKIMLAKIDSEDFGRCRQCDDPIPMGRLLALPGEDRCVQCAQSS